MAAVARFRKGKFGQYLYSGDILADTEHYDERDWTTSGARAKLFSLTLEAAARIAKSQGGQIRA